MLETYFVRDTFSLLSHVTKICFQHCICAEGTSQADMFTCQFGAAREPELFRKV